MGRLGQDFYRRSTLTVARELLGQRLVRVMDGQRLSGFIVEVEAYIGEDDAACHAARGRTPRNEVMYGPPGHTYVYFVYGMHHCLNVVTEEEGFPAAVLVRALQPLEGLDIMRRHRSGKPDGELVNGPAKLCQALAIKRDFNGVDLCTSEVLFIERGRRVAPEEIGASSRIGIKADEIARSVPWRFYFQGSDFVSKVQHTSKVRCI
ncbi:MAG: DNA-3-methyladenine glycosylase [Chloroflexi bacterium]|nr:DNA-3-methyladenine glycosylase [Chloroflexota bacterium]